MSHWEDEERRHTGLVAAAACLALLAVAAPAAAHGGGDGKDTAAPPPWANGNPHAPGARGNPHAEGEHGNPHAVTEAAPRSGAHGHAHSNLGVRARKHRATGPVVRQTPQSPESQPQAPEPQPQPHGAAHAKTTICHATGSATNPYVEITISDRALAAHRRHQDGRDIIPAPQGGCPSGRSAQPVGERPAKEQGKTTICHATGSASNPYVEITISDNALAAHRRHQDGRDIIPAPQEGCPGPAATAFTVPPVAPSLGPVGPPAVTPEAPAPTTSAPVSPAAVGPSGTAGPVPPAAIAPAAAVAPAATTAPGTPAAAVAPAGTAAPATGPAAPTPPVRDSGEGAPAGGVLGVSASGTEPAASPAVAAVRTARGGGGTGLPFTGLTVAFLAAGGLGLLLAGTALRRAGTLRHR